MKNIVLIDFTEESLHALEYAVAFTRSVGGKLELVNVVPADEFDLGYSRLTDLRNRYSSSNFLLDTKVVTGSLEHDLPAYIEEQKIGFVCCGTHDLRLMEYLFSSRALKLMNSIDANFLFVPKTLKTFRPIKKVLAPILVDKHSLQKLEALRYLYQMIEFELTLITFKSDDKDEVREINQRLFMAGKILDQVGVPFKIDYLGRTEEELKSDIIEYATQHEIDMISMVNLTESGFININAKAFMDSLIRNDYKIPILATQDKQLSSVAGHHVSGGA